MKNPNLDRMIDTLHECPYRHDKKISDLYEKNITIAFNGLSCEIPFNALNYITLINTLCHISMTEEYSPQANDTMFDVMRAEQLCFNLNESIGFEEDSDELKELYGDLVEAMKQRHEAYLKLSDLVNISAKEFWKLKEELRKII